MKTLLIDNYDSYTFNLYQMLAAINGREPVVVRNDALSWEQLREYDFDNIVISPGPGRPEREDDFGICRQAILEAEVPVLGVCLGHQGIGSLYGAKVKQAPEIMHGRLSELVHSAEALFDGIPQHSRVVRYHSLVVEDLPEELEGIAWTADGVLMGLRHRSRPLWGVQYHPESICTQFGEQVLRNFGQLTLAHQAEYGRGHQDRKPLEQLNQLYSPLPGGKEQLSWSWAEAPGLNGQKAGTQVEPNEAAEAAETAEANGTADARVLPSGSPRTYEVLFRKLTEFPDAELLYRHFANGTDYSFWLDSSRTGEDMGRFSYISAAGGPLSRTVSYSVAEQLVKVRQGDKVAAYRESIYDYLERELAEYSCSSPLPFDFTGGFAGCFGYELKAESGGDAVYASPLPDALFLFADRLCVIDHEEQLLYLVALTESSEGREAAEEWLQETAWDVARLAAAGTAPDAAQEDSSYPADVHSPEDDSQPDKPILFHLHRSYEQYTADIERAKQLLREGETYEINLTNELSTEAVSDPLALYCTLRHINPAPYSAYMRFGGIHVVCSSPERFLTIDQQGRVEAKPIKGTSRRGATKTEDEELREQLRGDEKTRAENLMIVDLLRNDLGLVCEVGSVHVPKLMDVETYETVHQLVSTVRGQLRPDVSAVGCVRAAFPGGSMTGAPKLRTMALIDQLEQRPRGLYSGAIGFLGVNGSADLNIVIRTIICTEQAATIGVGGAIVMQSDPELEYDEILLKAKALIQAIVTAKFGRYGNELYVITGGRGDRA
ncbi:aminodeoxychorismate synthase component I [Paenibacillus sambharensis]|uniref:aminodeoxychorismate synthase n=1 Tax=Paenibacillus sambharensis TaxID=1803190 RepID=A0A2W1LDG3_9BACL|nr:aminodeoxychorismate synthase component I [Paenibacillus sambharensis]PZD96699.1 aminodeoxychorismate synthase component I [Paenibacillus sambharensis]